MRERLTFAFVAITLLLLVGAGLVRSVAVREQVRARELQYVQWEAQTIARVAAERTTGGRGLRASDLRSLVPPTAELVYRAPGRSTLTVRGGDFSADAETLSVPVVLGAGTLTVEQARDDSINAYGLSSPISIIALLALFALLAGVVGYFVARALSEPFRQLALAAAALGRGRFDLDLPDTRVPEARAISSALSSSAAQLKDRLERDREFGLHTSHVLRTPLTSLRLYLEELLADDELSPDARQAALGCLRAVGQLTEVAGELVDISGRGVLLAGAAQPLRDIATAVAQRWADALDEDDGRRLTAAVEGDIELQFTPGPIEQVLDHVLREVVLPDRGDVRVVFEGAASRLRIDIVCIERSADGTLDRRPPRTAPGDAVAAILSSLGGRAESAAGSGVMRLHLPRR